MKNLLMAAVFTLPQINGGIINNQNCSGYGPIPTTTTNPGTCTRLTYAQDIGIYTDPQINDCSKNPVNNTINNAKGTLTLDLYTPTYCQTNDCSNIGMLVEFHGGGGSEFADAGFNALKLQAQILSSPQTIATYNGPQQRHGWFVADINYPLQTSGTTGNEFPIQNQAAICALRALKANSQIIGFNGDKIVVSGYSFGTILAGMLSALSSNNIGPIADPTIGQLPMGTNYDNENCAYTQSTNTLVLGFLDFYGFPTLQGVIDPVSRNGGFIGPPCPSTGAVNAQRLLGVSGNKWCESLWQNIALADSTQSQMQSLTMPPTLIARGNMDEISPNVYSANFAELLTNENIENLYIPPIAGTGHGWFLLPHGNGNGRNFFDTIDCTAITFIDNLISNEDDGLEN